LRIADLRDINAMGAGLIMAMLKTFGKWFVTNWERILFVIVGLALLGTSLTLIYQEKVTEAAAVFGLGFLSFIYANVARFKRFKGLGFEAELWEDKQKEAADLIERLREVVSIYTREVILGKVTAGRWGTKTDWENHWKLYDDLVTQHSALGQKIDFSPVKKVMDDYFLFDMTVPEITKLREAIRNGKAKAKQKIDEEFGSPIRDADGYGKRLAEFRKVPDPAGDPFQFSTQNDLAGHTLQVWAEAKERLKRDFDVDAEVDPKVIERLKEISKLYLSRPVQITDKLIGWANREG
jgi:hypothetical protein